MNPDPQPRPGALDPDDLERLLSRHPLRKPPADWRDAILSNALAGAATPAPTPAEKPGPAESRNGSPRIHPARRISPLEWWRKRFLSGWTVAAGAWVLILALNSYSAPAAGSDRTQRPPWSAAALVELRAQRRVLVDLAYATPLPAQPDRNPAGPAAPRRKSPPRDAGASANPVHRRSPLLS